MALARPDKLNHAQTILYEIDMLRFAAGKLEETETLENWSKLECFLLHFRNLIEFFGKNSGRKEDDLSIFQPDKWLGIKTLSEEQLKPLRREDLWRKYEGKDQHQRPKKDKISRYLQHCTEQRTEGKSWDVKTMFEELGPVLVEFEKLLPDVQRHWDTQPTRVLALSNASLSTASSCRGSAVIIAAVDKKR